VFTFDTKKSPKLFIFFLGSALGIATTALFKFFPAAMHNNLISLLDLQGKYLIVIILLIAAVFSLPASKIIDRYGVQNVFWYSTAAIIVCILGVLLIDTAFTTLLFGSIFALCFALLSVSSLPLAINEANYYEKVFCVGIFFSGVELPDSLVDIFTSAF